MFSPTHEVVDGNHKSAVMKCYPFNLRAHFQFLMIVGDVVTHYQVNYDESIQLNSV